ncbi:hypothetical protein [Aeromonas veronii]|uniref:hypothetical protein n=1 Tax=Aeromonas veronii TaxID=654 RepID=UPI0029371045|nr:hypothetical protein [Aeromonas veronii]WOE84114.1 hypothetical protein RY930_18940 [Aeromonas veronii]
MDKNRIQLAKDWNKFKSDFHSRCYEYEPLSEKLKSHIVYFSSDFDEPKKSQLVLAFMYQPINTYYNEHGGISVEQEWGCRLFYTFQYNGSVLCKIKDYDGYDYVVSNFSSAKRITKSKLENNFEKFLLVERCTSKITQPSSLDKLRFFIFKRLSVLSLIGMVTIIGKCLPIIKSLYK